MKNYLIIGASSGIGKETAKQLSAEGNNVIGTYNLHKPDSDSAAIKYFKLDVLDETLDLIFLPDTIDGLIYCPGSINLKPFNRLKPIDFLADFQLQVIGAIKVIQTVLPKLKLADAPSILMFSTVAVNIGMPYHSQVSTSKGAIEGLTKALAAEFAPKIRVNCLAPSLTDTPLAASLLNNDLKKEANAQRHPLKRIGTAADIANMASFLVSDKASWTTGQIFHIDGGMASLKV